MTSTDQKKERLLSQQDDQINEQLQQCSDSDEQQYRRKEQQLRQDIRTKKKIRRANSKMIVGTGFSFDITEFFKFEKKAKKDDAESSIFSEISGSRLAWGILFYSVINAALIPPLIMKIEATKFLRISWRFFLQFILIIPFVLYEKRVGNEEVKNKYALRHILQPNNLKKLYLSGLATTFWFTCILTCFQWTNISHAMVLGALSNFFLSIFRLKANANHQLESGGQVVVLIGIILIIIDSITLQPQLQPASSYNVINPYYLKRTWIQRVLADIIAILVSLVMSRFSRYTADLRNHYPPYLSMMLVNLIICINMMLSSFFFNGATFDFHSFYGVFSLLTQTHFAWFLYMGIIICLSLFLSFTLIAKLFPQPIIPALAMVFEPIISTLLLQLFGVQTMPGSYALIGCIFVIPGIFLILVGQCMFQRSQKKVQIAQKAELSRLIEQHSHKKLSKFSEHSKSVEAQAAQSQMQQSPLTSHYIQMKDLSKTQSQKQISKGFTHIKFDKRSLQKKHSLPMQIQQPKSLQHSDSDD